MRSVTLEEVKSWGPCWLGSVEGARKFERIGRRKEHWTALDVLDLPASEVSSEDKLWVVLRPELVEVATLHEFACRCGEEALKLVDNPDPRSVAAIEAKRKWLRGEIGDEELDAARDAASAVARSAARSAASAAASAAARAAASAVASAAAWDAASAAAREAASAAAREAARSAAWDAARSAASAAARDNQVRILRGLLTDGAA